MATKHVNRSYYIVETVNGKSNKLLPFIDKQAAEHYAEVRRKWHKKQRTNATITVEQSK